MNLSFEVEMLDIKRKVVFSMRNLWRQGFNQQLFLAFKSVICFGKAVVNLRQNAKYPKLSGRGSLKVVYVLKTKCASAHADMLALRLAPCACALE